jgi:hypothetical protein
MGYVPSLATLRDALLESTMIETDTLLVKCPHCGAWPMAASLPKPASAQQKPRLRCPKCRHQDSARLHRPGSALRLPQQRPRAAHEAR